ncbi:hypothetical protein PR001_g30276 [Phytophthora rubi]|uniref:Amine oxidase n=1 Tax=Phytophthora rubi TaxID=129364 RepID=A0A6A3GV70_9STRA|nr:hypothetical protein PR001_g30276 [Phytophthora rubi]
MHEEDFGTPLKHTDVLASPPIGTVRRQRRFVVSFFVTIDYYDYGFYWYFYLDGRIELECKATGIVVSTSRRPEGLTSTRRRWLRVSVRRATCTCSRPAWMSPSTAPRAMSTSKDRKKVVPCDYHDRTIKNIAVKTNGLCVEEFDESVRSGGDIPRIVTAGIVLSAASVVSDLELTMTYDDQAILKNIIVQTSDGRILYSESNGIVTGAAPSCTTSSLSTGTSFGVKEDSYHMQPVRVRSDMSVWDEELHHSRAPAQQSAPSRKLNSLGGIRTPSRAAHNSPNCKSSAQKEEGPPIC